ncbi:zinc-binding dehydrogenase [Rhodococcus sp. BP-349]|nr:zinc-binding dehydrogenase [Rhodococcus sp. BP-363]MBY6542273.1 zinc-binding dehydrogenase [Rhodococcus sp. BP-369]MBY6561503.1 zinc-binding dehydrogenase [Rhodococcus sp. BP-370]MBY6575795.1 zinc-binding dehydrogenase [Rhodococcus sp. BP-364]MBY6585096.1 zinc-binding dehydrogenase [Rhodococcus sp. BP-358]MBY6589433.1 zinc-binding dehydrogenase [Rhodococcus sp. BP-362]MBY6594034.1 zinc-binding dehydrogenase [Rhodococcus sp. BP-359]MBY6598109.1 zinc-binding dehydrogenase [Rhodococcus sp. B
MRAARVHAWGQAPVVEDVDVPVPGPGEALVQVEAASVAHLDVTVASGEFGIKPTLPYTGGVEGSGVVVESAAFPPGTKVVLRGGGLGLFKNGTWAEYVVVKDKALVEVPHGLSPEVAATFWVPTTTAHTALVDVGRLGSWLPDVGSASEEHVIVAGAAGAVGSMVTQLALRHGATVTALVADHEQASRVADGATAVVADDDERFAELAEQRPATLLVDTLGGSDLVVRSRWVRPGGRAVSIGYVAGNDVSIGLSNWLLDDVALLPVNMIRREESARAAVPELAALLAAGELTLDHETFSLDETGIALDKLGAGKVRGRAVVVPR